MSFWKATGTGPTLAVGAILSGGFLLLAQPPISAFPLAFVCLIPLAVGIGSLPLGPEGRWGATVEGLIFGLAFWGPTLVWVPLVVGPSFAWAYPGYAVLLLLLGGLSALLGFLIHSLRARSGIPLGLALPLAWVAVEWLKAHAPFGLAFPWMGLGVTLTAAPDLLGLAEWLGEPGVSFWIAAVNGLGAQSVLEWRRRSVGGLHRIWVPGGLALMTFALPAAAGLARTRTLTLTPGPSVAVVGTQVASRFRDRPVVAARETLSQVEAAAAGLEPGEIDLLVLPEGVLPISPPSSERADLLAGLDSLGRRLRTPLLFGALGESRVESREEDGISLPTNSAFLLPTDGKRPSRYDKSRLVPAMERGRYQVGQSPGLFQVGEWTVAPLICYESLFGEMVRRRRAQGAEILINISNDVWFGRPGALPGSLFLRQHPAHLVLRAVENRVSVARAANGGFILLLDPRGRTVAGPVIAAGSVISGSLPLVVGRTLYSRTGDWVGPGALLACLALMAWGWKVRRSPPGVGYSWAPVRSPGRSPPPPG